MDAILDDKLRRQMNAVAGALNEAFKPRGFTLLVFDLGGKPGQRMSYISNADRDDMIVAMKEFIAFHEGRLIQGEGTA